MKTNLKNALERIYSELEKIYAKINDSTERGEVTNTYALHNWLDKWRGTYKEQGLKPKTVVFYHSAVNALKRILPDTPLGELGGLELQSALLEYGYIINRKRLLSVLNTALSKAVKLGLIKTNPCESVELPYAPKRRKSALSVSEQAALFNAVRGHIYEPLFRFLLTTGVRIGEALALTGADFCDGKVTIDKNIVWVYGKTIPQDTTKTISGNRIIPVPSETLNALTFPDNDGERIFPYFLWQIDNYFIKLSKTTGIHCTPHTLRHTYATRLDEAGVPPKVKQYLMGHKNLNMTENVYTDVKQEFIDAQSELVKSVFDNAE
jgi:integrase